MCRRPYDNSCLSALYCVSWRYGLIDLAKPTPRHAMVGSGAQRNPKCTPQQHLCLDVLQFVLWRDVLSQHAKAPLHAMVGGGDQIYNDEVFSGKHVQEWLHSGRKVGTFIPSWTTTCVLPYVEVCTGVCTAMFRKGQYSSCERVTARAVCLDSLHVLLLISCIGPSQQPQRRCGYFCHHLHTSASLICVQHLRFDVPCGCSLGAGGELIPLNRDEC